MTPLVAQETKNLAELYDQELMPWTRALEALAKGDSTHVAFLNTVGPDGRPHSAPLGVAVADGVPYFQSGPGTRKSRNVAANPSCTLAMRLEGIDLVLEGEARRVTDAATLEQAVAVWVQGGWPATVEGDAITAPYNAQSAGPGPWHVFQVDVHTAFGVATSEPHGASRWRF